MSQRFTQRSLHLAELLENSNTDNESIASVYNKNRFILL